VRAYEFEEVAAAAAFASSDSIRKGIERRSMPSSAWFVAGRGAAVAEGFLRGRERIQVEANGCTHSDAR